MPEEKSKNKADAEAHEPGYEEERGSLHVLELAKHRHPFRHLASRLCEHLLKYRRLDEQNDSGGHDGWPQFAKARDETLACSSAGCGTGARVACGALVSSPGSCSCSASCCCSFSSCVGSEGNVCGAAGSKLTNSYLNFICTTTTPTA